MSYRTTPVPGRRDAEGRSVLFQEPSVPNLPHAPARVQAGDEMLLLDLGPIAWRAPWGLMQTLQARYGRVRGLRVREKGEV